MTTSREAPSRLRMTGYAAAQLLLAVPTLVLFILNVVSGVLVIAWLGIAVLLVTLPASRWIANRHRSMATRVLGLQPVDAYVQTPSGSNPVQRLTTWARDPMTWRDLAWALVSIAVGFALSLLTVLLLLAAVTGALWWFGVEPIMRARSRLDLWLLSYGHTEELEQRVQVLTETRAESVDHSAAELRRIERDLHDGAQARLVALGMSLGMADDVFATDPEAARKLVTEARSTTGAALGELRSVVRGIHPPVLADRGLSGAVSALALDMAMPVTLDDQLTGRPPAPVESALYFAIAECLANVGKHSGSDVAWVSLAHAEGRLTAVVGDRGKGGADPSAGTGMRGVMRRLSAFDGTMRVSSPGRGPTLITLEVPCALSSQKIMPSSGKA